MPSFDSVLVDFVPAGDLHRKRLFYARLCSNLPDFDGFVCMTPTVCRDTLPSANQLPFAIRKLLVGDILEMCP